MGVTGPVRRVRPSHGQPALAEGEQVLCDVEDLVCAGDHGDAFLLLDGAAGPLPALAGPRACREGDACAAPEPFQSSRPLELWASPSPQLEPEATLCGLSNVGYLVFFGFSFSVLSLGSSLVL